MLNFNVWKARCIKCIFNLRYFQLMMGLLGHNPTHQPILMDPGSWLKCTIERTRLFEECVSWQYFCCSVTQSCLTLCDPMDCNPMDFATPWTAARQASLSFTISWSLLKLMSIEFVMPTQWLNIWWYLKKLWLNFFDNDIVFLKIMLLLEICSKYL